MAEALDPAIPAAIDELAQQVLRAACDRGLMLVTAESCTGGLLASRLTGVRLACLQAALEMTGDHLAGAVKDAA